jgi:hypothetical protein
MLAVVFIQCLSMALTQSLDRAKIKKSRNCTTRPSISIFNFQTTSSGKMFQYKDNLLRTEVLVQRKPRPEIQPDNRVIGGLGMFTRRGIHPKAPSTSCRSLFEWKLKVE